MWLQRMWAQILKAIFFLSLFSICLFEFGRPCIQKFFDRGATVNEFVTKTTSLKPPAITICPQKWKNNTSPSFPYGNYMKNCKDANGSNDFSNCVANKTFGIDEVIISARQGWNLTEDVSMLDLSDSNIWTSDMTITTGGRCYTLKYDQHFKVDPETDSIVIDLVVGDYYIILHNPDFLLTTMNPLALPLNLITFDLQEFTNKSFLGLTLEVVQRQNLDREEVPCNPSPDYNFTACVKKGLARIVNCTLPWNDEMKGFHFYRNKSKLL